MRKVAFHNGIKGKAESEFCSRLNIVSKKHLGFEFKEVITSNEIYAYNPDLVVQVHHSFPKLTEHPTLGLMWNPASYYLHNTSYIKNITSYDGYLYCGEESRVFLEDLSCACRRRFVMSEFFPSYYGLEFQDIHDRFLVYIGANWDGKRHEGLLESLTKNGLLYVYGPSESWNLIERNYCGETRLDGVHTGSIYSQYGMGLCLHEDQHLRHGIPNMRIFECVANSAIPICDEHSFVLDNFKDTCLYIDAVSTLDEKLEQIREHIIWSQNNKKMLCEMAREAHKINNSLFSIEKWLPRLDEIFNQSLEESHYRSSRASQSFIGQNQNLPTVDVIVRTGSRDVSYLRRALESIFKQSYLRIRILIISFNRHGEVANLISEFTESPFEIVHHSVLGENYRSTAMWDGLRIVSSDYFCFLDDDDRFFPNHIASLVDIAVRTNHDFVFSGSILAYENENNGAETRRMAHFETYNTSRIFTVNNYIASNSYIASRNLLTPDVLVDPRLETGEDFWLIVVLSKKTRFIPSLRVSSEFYWNDKTKENTTYNKSTVFSNDTRIKVRTFFDTSIVEERRYEDWENIAPAYFDKKFINRYTSIDISQNKFPQRKIVFRSIKTFPQNRIIPAAGHIDLTLNCGKDVLIRGWGMFAGLSINQTIYVYSSHPFVIRSNSIIERKDVVEYFNDNDFLYSGFELLLKIQGNYIDYLEFIVTTEDASYGHGTLLFHGNFLNAIKIY